MKLRRSFAGSRGVLPGAVSAVVLGFALGGCGVAPRATPSRDPNIFLIVIDALRADHLGAYGYSRPTSPNIDRIAREGVVFENALSAASWTRPAMGSLFTSLHPHVHGATAFGKTLPTDTVTLAETLHEHGYVTAGFQANPLLFGRRQFGQGFDSYSETSREPSSRMVSRVTGWLDERQPEKFAVYIHVMDVHLPYDAPTENRARFLRPYSGPLGRVTIRNSRQFNRLLPTVTDDDRRHMIDLYDAAINQADDSIGAIVADLTRRQLIDDTILIITADHGEELFDHGDFTHGHSMYREVVQIPLIIWNPRLKASGVRVKQLVRQIDIYPTVLGFLAVPQPSFLMGRDLGPAIADPNLDWELDGFTEGVLHGPPQWALQKGRLKLIKTDPAETRRERRFLDTLRRRPGWTDASGAVEFYDLKRDPGERHSLVEHPAKPIWAGLLEALRTADGGVHLAAAPERLDKEKVEQLRSLGYVR